MEVPWVKRTSCISKITIPCVVQPPFQHIWNSNSVVDIHEPNTISNSTAKQEEHPLGYFLKHTIGYQDQTQSITSKPKQILSFRTTQQIKKHHKLEAWKYQPDGKGVID